MLLPNNMIKTKKQLKDYLSVELPFYKCGFLQKVLGLSENGILRKHQIYLRKAEYFYNTHNIVLSTWYRYKLVRIQNKYAIHIPINCCEKGLHIMHIGPIIINNNAQIGKNCSLHINTAVVANGITGDAPHLGDNIVLGIGSVVVGPIFLSNHTAVGANAVVNKSVTEECTTVAGVPAKKVSTKGSLGWKT